MKPGPFVLDNSVLSAFYRQDWLSAISVHPPAREPVVSRLVWEGEFCREHDVDEPWEWLDVREASRYPWWNASKTLSNPDLACLGLAEEFEGTVITNDKQLLRTAESRDTPRYWGTEFLLETLEACGISQTEFDDGKEGYIDDVHLPEEAAAQLLRAEKQT